MRNTSATKSKRHNRNSLSARELISAHKQALERSSKAEAALEQVEGAPLPYIIVPEIGPGQIYSLERFEEVIQQHINLRGLSGMDSIQFRDRMARYRNVLKAQIDLETDWNEQCGRVAKERECETADDAKHAAWDSLIARLKEQPRDHALIASYLATLDGQPGCTRRLQQALKAIASSGRRK